MFGALPAAAGAERRAQRCTVRAGIIGGGMVTGSVDHPHAMHGRRLRPHRPMLLPHGTLGPGENLTPEDQLRTVVARLAQGA